jgi:endonuclease/exonuclease/phosphatase family metal-dependent hydrolase
MGRGLTTALVLLLAGLLAAGHFSLIQPAGTLSARADAPANTKAEWLRVATYNIEHLAKMFDQEHIPWDDRDKTEFFRDQEDLYEVSRVIQRADFDADVIAIQECCSQENLEHFNKHWLDGRYGTVKVFEGNSTRGQQLGFLIKPGIKLLKTKEFSKDPDPVDDPELRELKKNVNLAEGNLLFSRGPAFVKLRTRGGNVLWVGCTHVKSKYGDSPAVVRWRIREIQRTRELCGELLKTSDTDYLIMAGDFNDSPGKDDNEKTVGTDAVSVMTLGKGPETLVNLTDRILKDKPDAASYHCELKPPRYRSFLDYLFVSPALAEHVNKAYLVDPPLAAVASDHFPLVGVFRLPVEKDGNRQ